MKGKQKPQVKNFWLPLQFIEAVYLLIPNEITYFGGETSTDLMTKWISTENSAVYTTVFLKPNDDGYYFVVPDCEYECPYFFTAF